jgi:phage shock protein C
MLQHPFKDLIEKRLFGVCTYLGDKMLLPSAVVRKYFIYLSFITMGSPLIIYLVAAFWVNIRKYLRPDGNPIHE